MTVVNPCKPCFLLTLAAPCAKPTNMHHTPDQKNILRTTWIPAIFFAVLFGLMYFWREKTGENSFASYKLAFLFPYANFLLIWVAWSWDWLVTKNYAKAGILFLATVGFWAITEYLLPERRYAGDGNMSTWLYIRNAILFSPILWTCVVRAVMEMEKKRAMASLLAGITLIFLYMLFSHGLFGITIFTMPYLVITEYLFRNGWSESISNLFYTGEGSQIASIGIIAADVLIVQWIYQLYHNLQRPEERDGAKGIFGLSFPAVSGRYFAAVFPALYVFTVAAATGIIIYTAQLFVKGFRNDFSTLRIGRLRMPMPGDHKIMPWIMIPICIFLMVVLFKALRTLVISRCITLNKKIGFTYLFSFVPFLNIIPWIILSVTKTPTDETERMDYVAEMNDGQKQRSMATINFLITLAVLNALFVLVAGAEGGGPLSLVITLLTLGMYIGFVYRPGMIYGIIAVKVLFLIIVSTLRYSNGDLMLFLTFFSLYNILMLFWQQKIFFPDVMMPVEVTFDGENEMRNNEQKTIE